MKEQTWGERAARLFCLLCGGVGLWVLLRYASAVVWAVGICWGVALVVTPPAEKLSRLLGCSRRPVAAVLVLLLFFGGGALLWLGIAKLWGEGERLFLWLSDNRDWLKPELQVISERFFSRIPFLSEGSLLAGWLDDLLASLGKTLATGIGQAAKGLPGGFLFLVVSVMGSLYLSMDYEAIRDRALSLLPEDMQARVASLRSRGRALARGWLRAYLFLMLLTFSEVLVGLLILRRPYPVLLAAAIAVLDILPVLGAGLVLIPWGLLLLARGQTALGVGMLILYAAVTVVRQIAEPKLVGDRLGLHPFVSLMTMFAGLRLFGFAGMLLGPVLAVAAKEMIAAGQIGTKPASENKQIPDFSQKTP